MRTDRALIRVRRGLALVAAVAVLVPLASTQPGNAKTTKKAKKKAAATTVKKAAAAKPTATTAKPTFADSPPKSIIGQEVAPGAPIKIGVLGSIPTPTGGDLEVAYNMAFSQLRKEGKLPVHGRDVVVYFRGYTYNSADTAVQARAACTASAQDDKVFAALMWAASPECLAGDYKVPTIGQAVSDESMDRTFPYAFSIFASVGDALRNQANWAVDLGLLKGRKVGIIQPGTAGFKEQLDRYFKPELKKAGITIAEHSISDDDAGDRVAVQRMKAAGVNTVFMMGRFSVFANAGRAQGFKPKYILGNGQNIICGGCPTLVGLQTDLFDGTYAYTDKRFMEDGLGGNPPLVPAGVKCASDYEKLTGTRVRLTGTFEESTRYQAVSWACLQAEILVNALQAAGPNLTQGALINAMERNTKNVQSGVFADVTWSPTSHFGSHQHRTVVLEGSCMCYRARGPLVPNT